MLLLCGARIGNTWPSVRTRVLCIKLGFLLKILNSENSLSARVFHSLAVSDVEALQLIRQCRFLESSLNTNFTTRILSSHQEISFAALKKEIFEVDFSLLLSEASNHASQCYVQAVTASSISSWPKVWDSALEKVLLVPPFWYLLVSHTAQTTQSTHTLRQQMPCSQLLLYCWQRLSLLSLSSWSHHFIHHSWTVCRHPRKLLRIDLLMILKVELALPASYISYQLVRLQLKRGNKLCVNLTVALSEKY